MPIRAKGSFFISEKKKNHNLLYRNALSVIKGLSENQWLYVTAGLSNVIVVSVMYRNAVSDGILQVHRYINYN